MRITIAYRDGMDLPSRGTVDTLVRLARLKPPVSLRDVVDITGTENKAKAFLVNASRSGIIIRGSWDTYYPVPPHAALWSALLMDYYRDLCRLHGALKRAGIPHAFGCVTASMMSDYVPGIPIVAVPMEDFDSLEKADVYGITATPKEFRSWSDRIGFKWPDGAFIMNVPLLPPEWTALLLGAIGQPREISAAKEILDGREVDATMARRLNSVGLVTRDDVIQKEPSVREPKHVIELRRRYAESLRQLNIMRG
jgi:hypothetical protein